MRELPAVMTMLIVLEQRDVDKVNNNCRYYDYQNKFKVKRKDCKFDKNRSW